jgi:hypothetical protein
MGCERTREAAVIDPGEPIGFSSRSLRTNYAAFISSIPMAILTIQRIINALRK